MRSARARSSSSTRFRRDERGTATIEFVLTIPLFFALLAFVFEFGRFFIAYQQTAGNVRAAARFISQVELSPENEIRAENIIRNGDMNGRREDAPVYLKDLCVSNDSIATGDCIIRQDRPIRIEVRVEYPLTILKMKDSEGHEIKLPFRIVQYVQPVGTS